MMILATIVISVLWLFQIVFLDKFYYALEIKSVEKEAIAIADRVEQYGGIEASLAEDEFVEAVEEMVYKRTISLEIVDHMSTILYQNSGGNMSYSSMGIMTIKKHVVVDAMQGKVTKMEYAHPKFGFKSMIVGIPIQEKGIQTGVVVVTIPLESVNETIEILKFQLIIITFILLLVASILSYVLSRNFTKPILSIENQVKAYAKGDYSVRNAKQSKDEIGNLAKEMNYMGEVLNRNEVLQKELIANVSHELRTPLTLIQGNAETLLDITGNNPIKREQQLKVIIEESKRLGKMVRDILNLSQMQSKVVKFEEKSVTLENLIVSVTNQYGVEEDKEIYVDWSNALLKEQVICDQEKIKQVFINVIDNAFRYCKEKKVVFINLLDEKEDVKIEIRDEGMGIAKEELEHVFDKYYKGTNHKKEAGESIGLGLSIVKSILQMHNSRFGIQSELDKGTIVWFTLKKSHKSF